MHSISAFLPLILASIPFATARRHDDSTTSSAPIEPSIPLSTSSYSYDNPFTIYLSETNSLGIITGMPSVVTSQPSVITSQPAVATIYATGPNYDTTGYPLPGTMATVVVPSGSSANTPNATPTATPSSKKAATPASASASQTTNAAPAMEVGVAAVLGLGGLFAAFL